MNEQQTTTTTATTQTNTQTNQPVHHPKARPSASCIPCRNRKVKVSIPFSPSSLSLSFSVFLYYTPLFSCSSGQQQRNLNTNM